MVKPLIPEEFLARIRALMRRPTIARPKGNYIHYKNITLDKDRQEFFINGNVTVLPKKEYLMLELLMERAGEIVRREDLIEYVWGDIRFDNFLDNTLNTTISRLKRRVGEEVEIQVVYKAGYSLTPKGQKAYITPQE